MWDIDCIEIKIDEQGTVHRCGNCAGCLQKKLTAAQEHIAALERDIAAAQERIYMPGAWTCPACAFVLNKRFLRAADGAVAVNDRDESELCPNDGATLRRVTWKEQADSLDEILQKKQERIAVLEAELAEAQRERDDRPTMLSFNMVRDERNALLGERDALRAKLDDQERGEHCHNCGRTYGKFVYSVPDDIWLKISPKASLAGLLCPVCALDKLCVEYKKLCAQVEKHDSDVVYFPPFGPSITLQDSEDEV